MTESLLYGVSVISQLDRSDSNHSSLASEDFCRAPTPDSADFYGVRNCPALPKLFRMAGTLELQLKEGDLAPGFEAEVTGGKKISLSGLRGKNVILYFYPKDDTPGCTKEACAFRDEFSQFTDRGAVVLGVSVDTVASHDKFAGKFKLPFPLVSDPSRKIVEAYGVWGQKSFMGASIWASIASPSSSVRMGGSGRSGLRSSQRNTSRRSWPP